jgi:hypothetical protein
MARSAARGAGLYGDHSCGQDYRDRGDIARLWSNMGTDPVPHRRHTHASGRGARGRPCSLHDRCRVPADASPSDMGMGTAGRTSPYRNLYRCGRHMAACRYGRCHDSSDGRDIRKTSRYHSVRFDPSPRFDRIDRMGAGEHGDVRLVASDHHDPGERIDRTETVYRPCRSLPEHRRMDSPRCRNSGLGQLRRRVFLGVYRRTGSVAQDGERREELGHDHASFLARSRSPLLSERMESAELPFARLHHCAQRLEPRWRPHMGAPGKPVRPSDGVSRFEPSFHRRHALLLCPLQRCGKNMGVLVRFRAGTRDRRA